MRQVNHLDLLNRSQQHRECSFLSLDTGIGNSNQQRVSNAILKYLYDGFLKIVVILLKHALFGYAVLIELDDNDIFRRVHKYCQI
jgi:hypothetical protein